MLELAFIQKCGSCATTCSRIRPFTHGKYKKTPFNLHQSSTEDV